VELAAAAEQSAPEKKKLTVREAFHFLAASKQVRCLALMAMAQGISTNLLEVSLPALIWCQLCYEGRNETKKGPDTDVLLPIDCCRPRPGVDSCRMMCRRVSSLWGFEEAEHMSPALQVAWKNHLHMLHPSPAAYAAFMGNVAMWTGIVTGSLMFCSPIMFERLGWRGVAGITPRFMTLTGPCCCRRICRAACQGNLHTCEHA